MLASDFLFSYRNSAILKGAVTNGNASMGVCVCKVPLFLEVGVG